MHRRDRFDSDNGSGAGRFIVSGPSTASIKSSSEIFCGSRASTYPPSTPRVDRRMSCVTSNARLATETVPASLRPRRACCWRWVRPRCCAASCRVACNAYSTVRESCMTWSAYHNRRLDDSVNSRRHLVRGSEPSRGWPLGTIGIGCRLLPEQDGLFFRFSCTPPRLSIRRLGAATVPRPALQGAYRRC